MIENLKSHAHNQACNFGSGNQTTTAEDFPDFGSDE